MAFIQQTQKLPWNSPPKGSTWGKAKWRWQDTRWEHCPPALRILLPMSPHWLSEVTWTAQAAWHSFYTQLSHTCTWHRVIDFRAQKSVSRERSNPRTLQNPNPVPLLPSFSSDFPQPSVESIWFLSLAQVLHSFLSVWAFSPYSSIMCLNHLCSRHCFYQAQSPVGFRNACLIEPDLLIYSWIPAGYSRVKVEN